MVVSKYNSLKFTKFLSVSKFVVAFVVVTCVALFIISTYPWRQENLKQEFVLRDVETAPEIRLEASSKIESERDGGCHYFNCFDVYKCGISTNKISVYIYPIFRYVDEKGVPITATYSEEFTEILETIYNSPYYVSNPDEACIFVPSIDLLNQNTVRLTETSQVLASLPYWNHGVNHLLFNMLPGSVPDYNSVLEVNCGKAFIAGAGWSTWSYRRSFDISTPVYSPIAKSFEVHNCQESSRNLLAISTQTNIHYEYRHELEDLAEEHPELLVLGKCSEDSSTTHTSNMMVRCRGGETYPYPAVLMEATFCLIIRGARLGQMAFSEAMKAGCIPVVVADAYVKPFDEVIDWQRASVTIYEENLADLVHVLKSISDEKVSEMRKQVCFLYEKYFKSMKQITETVLHILNDRIFPQVERAKSYEEWNDPQPKAGAMTPLFLPAIAPKSQGFTAVILTYDRLESLFQVIQRVVLASSLAKILVVWNNQKKAPPPASMWPKINKPLKVVQTKENKLSNRFFPYDEIETEAVLAIDDDIIMLTADELEFGYEVWREFPDRIVGFPSRVHLYDNTTGRWKYESEWTNEISMVLTGAAFYHKYYSYLYTSSMPCDIKQWVDEHMNCEDIAMNFLVANVTGKAPIKVTPRKKFKCPECTNVEMLSADVIHMAERSECINRFAENYGSMQLKTVEFRADPVLYKDNFPEKLKRFNNVGSL